MTAPQSDPVMKFCRDCRFAIFMGPSWKCTHPQMQRDVVNGAAPDCAKCRSYGACGFTGSLFEPQPARPPVLVAPPPTFWSRFWASFSEPYGDGM